MSRIIAICNAKGGVGKTTTAINLGSYLALAGKKVLLVDFDPQSNASSGLGFVKSQGKASVYEGVLGAVPPISLLCNSEVKRYDFIPAHPNLAGLTIELLDKPRREYFLKKFLNPFEYLYDYILIDLPPSVSLLTINGLVASQEIIIPVQCEYYGLEGLGQLLETIDLLNKNLGCNLKIAGALITLYDSREHLSREVAKEVRRHFKGHVYDVEIPRSIALAEAPSFSKPISLYAPESPGAKAYERLAREVITQEKDLVLGAKEVRVPIRVESAVKNFTLQKEPETQLIKSGDASNKFLAASAEAAIPKESAPKILFEFEN